MDLDGDGIVDLTSGSWPGEIYWFRQFPRGKFLAGATIKGRDGKPLNVGSAASPHFVDWDADGDLDLLIGTILGKVFLVLNEGSPEEFSPGEPAELSAGDTPIKHGEAAPIAADWDGDGKLDLIVGTEGGSVWWHRNQGTQQKPELAAGELLIPESPVAWKGDLDRRPGQWGLRVKPCAIAWDGDGQLDLLLGDRCGGFEAKPSQLADERKAEDEAASKLPGMRKAWADVYREYQAVLREQPDSDGRNAQLKNLRSRLQRYKDEIAVARKIELRYRPQYQSHGFVWLFQRKPQAR